MSSSYRLTDQEIARRLAERTASPNPGLVADILRAIETHPRRRGRLFDAWSTASVLLVLALLLVALAAIGIATAPPPMPPGLSLSVGRPMGGLQLSPDGRWGLPMAPGQHHAVVSTDPGAPRAADGSYKAVVTLKGGAGGGAAWSADSRYLAWHAVSDPGVVTIYDLDHPDAAPTSISVAAALSGTAVFAGMLWSPDGSQILLETANCEYPCSAAGSATQLSLLDVRTGSMKVVSRTLPPGFASTWAPDGQSVGFVGGLIVDLHGQAIRDLLPAVSDSAPSGGDECGSGPVWSADGKRIAIIESLTPDSGRLLIFEPGASAPRVLAADACAIVGWSPAGDRIVFRTGDPYATDSVQQGQGGGLQPTGPGSDAWIVSVDGGQAQLIKHLGWGEVPILDWSSPGG